MSTDYEPGTVAIATVVGAEGVRVSRYDGGWARLDDPDQFYSDNHDSESGVAPRVTDIRPLVVLDPQDFDTLDRLVALFHESWSGCEGSRGIGIGGALLKLTEPPRIPEPGLWGVVEAPLNRGGYVWQWVHHPKDIWLNAEGDSARWGRLVDPVLIREGVES